jgi:hypothetical protein
MGKQEDFVLRALEERDVRFVRLWPVTDRLWSQTEHPDHRYVFSVRRAQFD